MLPVNHVYDGIENFFEDERGEVTIEWVSITAAIIGMSVAVMLSISEGTRVFSENVGNELSTTDVIETF